MHNKLASGPPTPPFLMFSLGKFLRPLWERRAIVSVGAEEDEGAARVPELSGGVVEGLTHETRIDPLDRAIALRMHLLDDDGKAATADPWRFPGDKDFQRVYNQVAADPAATRDALAAKASRHFRMQHGLATAGTIEKMWSDFGFKGPAPSMGGDDLAALAELLLNLTWESMGAKSSLKTLDGTVEVTFPEGRVLVHPAGGVRMVAGDLIVVIETAEASSRMYMKDPWYAVEDKEVDLLVRPFRYDLKSEGDIGWNIKGAAGAGRAVTDVYVQGFVELNEGGLTAEARAAVMMRSMATAPKPLERVVLFDTETLAQDIVITVRHAKHLNRPLVHCRVTLPPK